MEAILFFVPPGGGETDYQLEMEMPAVPNPGDYITVMRSGKTGTETFIVRRTWWRFEYDDTAMRGKTTGIGVECEFADSPFATESHKRACKKYGAGSFEETGY